MKTEPRSLVRAPRRRLFAIVCALFLTSASFSSAQCPSNVNPDHATFSYAFSPVIDGDATLMHVTLTIDNVRSEEILGQFNLRLPGQATKNTVSPWINLRALSPDTTIEPGREPSLRLVRFKVGKPVILSYDLQKDWPGAFVYPRQFDAVIYPTWFELLGSNSLARPRSNPDDLVTVNFDWTALPAGWALATSFGTGTGAASRCQTFTGIRERVDDAIFAGGDFRLRKVKLGDDEVNLAIRGAWNFSDEDAARQLAKPIGIARDFWHSAHVPFFLVTVAPFDSGGSTDGSAYTNAFWYFMGPNDSLAQPRIQKDLLHEAFHEWNPRRMGVLKEPQQASDWFSEGLTEYYANLLAYRAGLLTPAQYTAIINQNLDDYSANSKNPYEQGVAIGLWLDAAIRANFGGAKSLDDVMLQMVHDESKPLSEARILSTIDEYLSAPDRDLLRAAINQDAPLPLAGSALEAPCMQVTQGETTVFDLGLDFAKSKTSKLISGVEPDGPAWKAGLRDGQKLVTWSVVTPETEKIETFVIMQGDEQKKLTYYARKTVPAPQLRAEPGCAVPHGTPAS